MQKRKSKKQTQPRLLNKSKQLASGLRNTGVRTAKTLGRKAKNLGGFGFEVLNASTMGIPSLLVKTASSAITSKVGAKKKKTLKKR